jgi:hypothetical protein
VSHSARRNVVAAIAERRHHDANHVETHEVEPEPPGSHFPPQIAVRRRDQGTSTRRGVLPYPSHLAVLERAQELGLCPRRQLADFVEKERAEVRLLEDAGTLRNGPGERPAAVAEQLGIDQIVGERRAVQRRERPIAPDAPAVHRPRHQFLARAALPFDQDRKRRGGRAPMLPHVGDAAAVAEILRFRAGCDAAAATTAETAVAAPSPSSRIISARWSRGAAVVQRAASAPSGSPA